MVRAVVGWCLFFTQPKQGAADLLFFNGNFLRNRNGGQTEEFWEKTSQFNLRTDEGRRIEVIFDAKTMAWKLLSKSWSKKRPFAISWMWGNSLLFVGWGTCGIQTLTRCWRIVGGHGAGLIVMLAIDIRWYEEGVLMVEEPNSWESESNGPGSESGALIGPFSGKQPMAGKKNHCCCKEDRSRHGGNSGQSRVISWYFPREIQIWNCKLGIRNWNQLGCLSSDFCNNLIFKCIQVQHSKVSLVQDVLFLGIPWFKSKDVTLEVHHGLQSYFPKQKILLVLTSRHAG